MRHDCSNQNSSLTIAHIALATALSVTLSAVGCNMTRDSGTVFGPERRNPNSIVQIRHSGLHFSVSIEENKSEASQLKVSFPLEVRNGEIPQLGKREVRARVKLMDQKIVFEDILKPKRLGIINAGWTSDSYSLSLVKGVAFGHVYSVVVWIDAERFEFYPF